VAVAKEDERGVRSSGNGTLICAEFLNAQAAAPKGFRAARQRHLFFEKIFFFC
jgi:hypothetical protein